MYKLVKRVIESNNLDVSDVLDTCYAICMADKFNGSNRLELSVDKLVVTADTEWNYTLALLGVQPRDGSPLPEVQRWRVICDALIICTDTHLEGVHLTSEASSKVASLKGQLRRCGEYHDIDDVKAVLTKLCGSTYDFTEVHALEGVLLDNAGLLKSYGYDLEERVKKAWSNIRLPDKFIMIERGEMKYDTEESVVRRLQELVMYQLESDALNYIYKGMSINSVKTNLFLSRAIKEMGMVGFGMQSFCNYAPNLEINCSNIPTVIITKLERLFAKNMNYDIEDLSNILVLLRNLYGGKVGSTYGI